MHVARTGQDRNAYKVCCKRVRKTLFGNKSRNGGVILKWSCGHRLHGCGFNWLRVQWRAALYTVMNLCDSHKAQNVLATVTKSKLFQDLYSSPYVFISLCFYGPQVQARKWRKQEAVALSHQPTSACGSWKADRQFPHQWTFCTQCRRLVAGRLVIDNDKEDGKQRQSRGWPVPRTAKTIYGTANTSVTIW